MPPRGLFFKGKKDAAVGSSSHQTGPLGAVMDKEEVGSRKEKMELDGSGGWHSWGNMATAGHLLWKSFRETYSSSWIPRRFSTTSKLIGDHIEPSATSYPSTNGAVEAACSLVGAVAAFSVGHLKVTWAVWGELALGLFSAVATGAVFLMALTSSIWACYAGYVIFKSCYMLLITITTFQIASNPLHGPRWDLDIVTQFIIYGSYYAFISALFLIRGTYTACTNQRHPELTQSKEHESSGDVISAERF
ncbi:hypothetical protein KUCAC02_006022 [Chaenocephalus aceratus]|uniref:Uncharacterized protein n=1 Tax=Chaenocephalus aceratus TaxID=36190 RepID=A0ACB9WRU6_CHAAC|nr:hypothetical protein KUCAC02_006022 [Chaenocephalus aceratus]